MTANDTFTAVARRIEAMEAHLRPDTPPGTTLTIALRSNVWEALLAGWIDYLTTATWHGGLTLRLDAERTRALTDEMRDGRFLNVNRRKIPVVLDDGIPESALTEVNFASDICFSFVPSQAAPPVTFAISDLVARWSLTRQRIHQIAAQFAWPVIGHAPGSKANLYAASDVFAFEDALARAKQRATLARALGWPRRTWTLWDAAYDATCPVCGGFAIYLPPSDAEMQPAWASFQTGARADWPWLCTAGHSGDEMCDTWEA